MQAKSNHVPETIKVQTDNGSLRLQFSTKYNPIFGGKRKHQGLAMKDTPENWQKAVAIAWRIEEDLQHSDWQKLFDPTFAKYGLKTKYAAELKLAAPIPESEPEMTVGTMWEDYLIWKQPQLQPTTFEVHYCKTLTNALKGLLWNAGRQSFSETDYSIWDMPISPAAIATLMSMSVSSTLKLQIVRALSEAFLRLQSLGKTKLAINPFVLVNSSGKNKTDIYKSAMDVNGDEREWWELPDKETDSEEKDRRAFTRGERDIIVNAFYTDKNPSPRQFAPLVEFLFLTGCRSGEAFGLHWGDVFRGKDADKIIFRLSYNGRCKNTQVTKTGESRIFKLYPKLNDLLLRIKPPNAKPTDLVFTKLNGKSWDSSSAASLWDKRNSIKNGIKYVYPGIVSGLADSGAISSRLSIYHTRHTFITLQAHAGTDLLLLATACGNSVEVIQRHYLGIDTTVQLTDI